MYEQITCEHKDVKQPDRGGPRLKDDRTDLTRCFTPITETHAPAFFKFYHGNDEAEYDYYAVVTNRTTRFFGMDESDYIASINAMESTPLITEHRSPGLSSNEQRIVTAR